MQTSFFESPDEYRDLKSTFKFIHQQPYYSVTRKMIGSFVLYFSVVTCAQSFLFKLKARNPFGHNVKPFAKLERQHFACEKEIALAVRPPWLQNFKNGYHTRTALDELAFAKVKLPSSDDAKEQMVASKIDDWTMPCYELDTNDVPVPVDTTELFDVNVKKTWLMDPPRAVETVFLGYDQRFGREDHGEKPKLFETVARMLYDSQFYTSRAYHAATYDEAQRTHNEVHEQAKMGKIEYFPHTLEAEY